MPMMPFLQALPSVESETTLAGVVVAGSFGLVYTVLKSSAAERAEERKVREKEAEAKRLSSAALERALETLQNVARDR